MCYVVERDWSQRCLGYFLLLIARMEGKTQNSDKSILLPLPRWAFELSKC